jgi:hypothetical protein
MNRLPLPQVTLCAVDTRTPARAAQALLRSMQRVQFSRVLLFTHGWLPRVVLPELEIVEIDPLADEAAEAQFLRRRLPSFVRSSHALVTRWDASVLHAEAWNDEFLVHDYIGAPAPGGGESGFSLRSRRLLLAGLDPRLPEGPPQAPQDAVTLREALQALHSVSFAPPPLASRFATLEGGASFGAVGAWHLPGLMSEPELLECLRRLPAAFFASDDAARFSRALARAGMPEATRLTLRRREEAGQAAAAAPLLSAAAALLGRLQPARMR